MHYLKMNTNLLTEVDFLSDTEAFLLYNTLIIALYKGRGQEMNHMAANNFFVGKVNQKESGVVLNEISGKDLSNIMSAQKAFKNNDVKEQKQTGAVESLHARNNGQETDKGITR